MDAQITPKEQELDDDGRRRRDFVRGGFSLGGAIALASTASAAPKDEHRATATRARTGGKLLVRWLGGGVTEIATPDYKQIAYGDAWIWNNAGWDRFGVNKPPEYASAKGFADYVASKKPDAVFVLLTHDHGDHMGDYFEMLKALSDAGLPVKTSGQSDMMRSDLGLVPKFRKAGLEPSKIVVNGGAGMNFGGVSRHGEMVAHLIPALHSNLCCYPAAGFILDIGGVRVYLSGDTDLFGDMRLIGERYKPDLGVVCVGGGPFTMGPQDAAQASAWVGVSHAIPVHYAHNGLVLGVEAGEQYRQAASHVAPSVQVSVMKPGEQKLITV